MFGLNLPDAIALSTFFVTSGAALVGLAKGKAERTDADERVVPFSIGGAVYAHQGNCDLVEAINGLADTIQDGFRSYEFEHRLHSAETLEGLRDDFAAAMNRRATRRRPGHKGDRP